MSARAVKSFVLNNGMADLAYPLAAGRPCTVLPGRAQNVQPSVFWHAEGGCHELWVSSRAVLSSGWRMRKVSCSASDAVVGCCHCWLV